jgi:hypothetical protein
LPLLSSAELLLTLQVLKSLLKTKKNPSKGNKKLLASLTGLLKQELYKDRTFDFIADYLGQRPEDLLSKLQNLKKSPLYKYKAESTELKRSIKITQESIREKEILLRKRAEERSLLEKSLPDLPSSSLITSPSTSRMFKKNVQPVVEETVLLPVPNIVRPAVGPVKLYDPNDASMIVKEIHTLVSIGHFSIKELIAKPDEAAGVLSLTELLGYAGFNVSTWLESFALAHGAKKDFHMDVINGVATGILRGNIREDQVKSTSKAGQAIIKKLAKNWHIPMRTKANTQVAVSADTVTFTRLVLCLPHVAAQLLSIKPSDGGVLGRLLTFDKFGVNKLPNTMRFPQFCSIITFAEKQGADDVPYNHAMRRLCLASLAWNICFELEINQNNASKQSQAMSARVQTVCNFWKLSFAYPYKHINMENHIFNESGVFVNNVLNPAIDNVAFNLHEWKFAGEDLGAICSEAVEYAANLF